MKKTLNALLRRTREEAIEATIETLLANGLLSDSNAAAGWSSYQGALLTGKLGGNVLGRDPLVRELLRILEVMPVHPTGAVRRLHRGDFDGLALMMAPRNGGHRGG